MHCFDDKFDLKIVLRDGVVYSDSRVAQMAFGFFRSLSDLFDDSSSSVDLTKTDYPPELTREVLSYCLAFAHFAPEAAHPPRPRGGALRVALDFLGGADLLCKAIDDHVSTPKKIDLDDDDDLENFAYPDRYIRDDALIQAIKKGRKKIAEAIVPRVDDTYLKYVDEDGNTALIAASYEAPWITVDILEAILARVDDEHIKRADKYGNTALIGLSGSYGYDLANAILARVDDEHLKHADDSGGTALLTAIKYRNEVSEAILARVDDEHLKHADDFGNTALLQAILYDTHVEFVMDILARVDDEHLKHANDVGNTALLLAIMSIDDNRDYIDLAEAILARVDDEHLKHANKDGQTALLLAIMCCEDSGSELAEAILARVDDEHLKHVNKDGETALILAVNYGWNELAEAIRIRVNPSKKRRSD